MNLLPGQKIFVSDSTIKNAGRGVFALKNIKKDEIIEMCPVIILPETEVPDIRNTILRNYYFIWGDDKKNYKVSICLGFGSLYNHSYTPNATYYKLLNEKVIQFIAVKDIFKDEEITVNYNFGNPEDTSPLWIQDIPPSSNI